jgi:hypothetical protein
LGVGGGEKALDLWRDILIMILNIETAAGLPGRRMK